MWIILKTYHGLTLPERTCSVRASGFSLLILWIEYPSPTYIFTLDAFQLMRPYFQICTDTTDPKSIIKKKSPLRTILEHITTKSFQSHNHEKKVEHITTKNIRTHNHENYWNT